MIELIKWSIKYFQRYSYNGKIEMSRAPTQVHCFNSIQCI